MKKIVLHDYAGHPFTFSFSKVLAKEYKVYHLFFANDPGPKSDLNTKKNKNLTIFGIGKTISYNKNNFFLRFFKDIQYGIEVKKKNKSNKTRYSNIRKLSYICTTKYFISFKR